MTPTEPQIVLTISGIGLSARAGDVFTPGKGVIAGVDVSWQALGVRFSESGSVATIGVLVRRPAALVGGTLTVPVHLRTTTKGSTANLRLVPSGPSSIALADGSDASEIAAALDPVVGGWFREPLVGLDGWYRTDGALPMIVGPAKVDGPVIRWEIATGLPAAPVDAGERALRPGMADDFTMAVSTELVTMLAQGHWTPVLRAGDPLPSLAIPGDFTIAVGRPNKTDRGFEVPSLARTAGRCRFADLRTEAQPAASDGGLSWKAPSRIGMPASHKVSDEERNALAATALDVLSAPLAALPLTGPKRYQAQARIVRSHENTLLLDGVLGAVKGRRLPKGPPPPIVPSATR